MTAMKDYFKLLSEKLEACVQTQAENIDQAAALILDSVHQGGNFYIFGTGHSHMIAEEMYVRAGGLAFVKAILPPEMMLHQRVNKSTNLERLSGYAQALLDLYPIQENDTMMIVSNSGRNAVPIEMCLQAQRKGVKVIALTSIKHSSQVIARHEGGKKLYELADLVIDNQAEYGDAGFKIEGFDVAMAGTSDFIGIAVVQALTVAIAEKMLANNEIPPIFKSGNMDGAEQHNRDLHQRYIENKMHQAE